MTPPVMTTNLQGVECCGGKADATHESVDILNGQHFCTPSLHRSLSPYRSISHYLQVLLPCPPPSPLASAFCPAMDFAQEPTTRLRRRGRDIRFVGRYLYFPRGWCGGRTGKCWERGEEKEEKEREEGAKVGGTEGVYGPPSSRVIAATHYYRHPWL
jgi:hypothetical protein